MSKVNTVDVMFCCSALFVQPGLQLISERNNQYLLVRQHSRKPMLAVVHYLVIKLFELGITEAINTFSAPEFFKYLVKIR